MLPCNGLHFDPDVGNVTGPWPGPHGERQRRGAGAPAARPAAGPRISAYTAEPGSASEGGLNLLASWAATLDQAEASKTAG